LDLELKKLEGEKGRLLREAKNLNVERAPLRDGKFSLERSVRQAFRILGFDVKEPEEYEEEYDLFGKEGEVSIIGEVEGPKNL